MNFNIQLYLAFCASIVFFLATPGPVTLLVAEQCRGSIKNAMLTILGTNTASLIYIAISLLTLSGLLNVNTNIINLLQVLGGVYLAYIGLDTFVNRKRLTNDASITAPTSSILGKSFFVGISNPKDILFFSGIFPFFSLCQQ